MSGGSERGRHVREVPVLASLTVVALGLVLAALHYWQTGVQVVGVGVLVAAGLRLSLPVRQAGLLVVRGRAFDAAVLLFLGFALVLLATVIPVGAPS